MIQTNYPQKIKLSNSAEAYIAALAVDLMLAKVELHQLSSGLLEYYVYAFEAGQQSLQPALDHAIAEADRYYAEMCRRPARPFMDANRPSFADLERVRGSHERADQIDAANVRRFAEVYR